MGSLKSECDCSKYPPRDLELAVPSSDEIVEIGEGCWKSFGGKNSGEKMNKKSLLEKKALVCMKV